jgi:hypothetical protein
MTREAGILRDGSANGVAVFLYASTSDEKNPNRAKSGCQETIDSRKGCNVLFERLRRIRLKSSTGAKF